MRSLNIEEPEVIEELVKETTIDFALWKEAVASRLFGRRFKKISR